MKKFALAALLTLHLIGCVLSTRLPTQTVEIGATDTPAPQPTHTPPLANTATLTLVNTATPTSMPPGRSSEDPFDLALFKKAMRPDWVGDVDRFQAATRYALSLDIDLDALSLEGQERVRYTNQESQSLDEIVFRLLPNTPGYGGTMDVTSIKVNGQAASFGLQLAGSAVYVPLETPLKPGEVVEMELFFSGALPDNNEAGYAQYGYIDGVLALPSAYPLIPVYDDEGWNVELAPTYGDATFSDVALYHVTLTLPPEMIVATSGIILEKRPVEDGKTGLKGTVYTFVSGPMRDLNIVASADYQSAARQVGDILVTSYYLDGDETGGRLALDYTVQALNIYQKLLGPYPFNELDVVATPTEAGGIEYPGLFVIARSLYGQTGGLFELVAVHETVHQWWYSLVGNDQLDEPWLDESLTQYTSLLYYEERYGPAVAQSILESSFKGWYEGLSEEEQKMAIGLPVSAYPEPLYGPIVYGKGPLFFHELRRQIGDEAFFKFLRIYFEQHRYGIAYPPDLVGTAEQVSGQHLDKLYEQWVKGE